MTLPGGSSGETDREGELGPGRGGAREGGRVCNPAPGQGVQGGSLGTGGREEATPPPEAGELRRALRAALMLPEWGGPGRGGEAAVPSRRPRTVLGTLLGERGGAESGAHALTE